MFKKERISIGWAEADITPAKKCELYGQYYQRVSKGIHSRLGATVLAMKSESGEQAIMISVDLTNFPLEFLNALRKKVKHLVPGIIPEKIMMNATHTHSAPSVSSGRNWWTPEPGAVKTEEYREFILACLADAVRRAWKSLCNGAISATRGHAVLGHCRRVVFSNGNAEMYGDTSRDDFMELEGKEDSTVELLFTYDQNKNTTGVIVNAVCPSQVMEATCLVSADFMGELRRLLKARFGDNFHTLCQVSSAGDQSPRDLVRDRNADFWSTRGVTIMGQRLADAVIEAYANIGNKEIRDRIEMAHQVRTISLPKRFPAYRELILAQKEAAGLEAILPSKKAFAAFTSETKRNEKIPGRP
ncbi:MAG: neutral/alkaline non-lysosomal ceramidase N-terminal domain-containing protein, partial [Verrucomicrobiota bacterium]